MDSLQSGSIAQAYLGMYARSFDEHLVKIKKKAEWKFSIFDNLRRREEVLGKKPNNTPNFVFEGKDPYGDTAKRALDYMAAYIEDSPTVPYATGRSASSSWPDPQRYPKEPVSELDPLGHTGYSSYGSYKHNPEEFRALCGRVAAKIPRLMKEYRADAIVARGSSGLSVAWGCMMLTDFNFVMLRRRNECSHGSLIEGNNEVFRRYLILDDFVASGHTVEKIMEDLPNAKCVGILIHSLGSYGLQPIKGVEQIEV